MKPLELQRLSVSKDENMHSGLKIITFGVLGLFLVASGGPSSPSAMDFDEDELARAVKAIRADVDAAMRSEDLDAYLSYYMEDAIWLPPGAEEYGKAAARQKLTSFFRAVNLEGASTVEEQTVMGPNWIGERGQFSVVLLPKQGDAEPVHAVGSYLALWTKDTDGTWKIALDMWNSDRGPTLAVSQ